MEDNEARDNEIMSCLSADCDFRYTFRFKKTGNNHTELWGMKSSTRESLKDWLIASRIAPEISEACANACSELMTNCIAYMPENSAAVMSITVNGSSIIVETANRADTSRRESVAESIKKLHGNQSAREIFAEKLLNPATDGRCHLGFAKIALETRGHIEFVGKPDANIVHVRVTMETCAV